ncbi:MAG: acyl-CoA mutase large subunit family protein [Planctomycetota bacterium]|jgi:methylmalonyl-CoA mutase N-terminal domain/subunit
MSGKKDDVRPARLESGIEVEPIYGPEDVERTGGWGSVGRPGEFPFTRGIHPLMYRKRPFTMRQYSGFGTARETNERFKWLIENGQTGLNVAFDLPTQIGLDSDDPMAHGEVGRVGMAVDSLLDFEEAFDGVDLKKITVSLTINGAAVVLMAMYFAMAEKRGYDLSTLRGTAQNDILKEYVGRGTWVFPVEPSMRLVGDTIEFCAERLPKYSPVSVCGYHIRESGCLPHEEMAYGTLIARAYMDHVIARGLSVDDFASRLSFNYDIHGNFLEQIAKFRAGRRLWARTVKEEYGAKSPRSMVLRMIAGGGGGGLTVEQPELNIVRTAYYALMSALSGTQTMALCSYDEAYTIPTEKAARITLRTMQIVIEESGICDTVDPLGGSWAVETLTNQMEEKIREAMTEVDRWGGIVNAIREGHLQAHVSRRAYQQEKAVREGRVKKVGVNIYRMEEEEPEVELHPYRAEEAEQAVARLVKLRAERSGEGVGKALDAVRAAATSGENVMPAVMEAVTVYATVGEIMGALKAEFGAFQEPVRF